MVRYLLLGLWMIVASTGCASAGEGGSEVEAKAGSCPCSGDHWCVGPRGGQYCYTSGGNKRYRKR